MPAAVLLALLLAAACSVKEDRRECPCYVHLMVDEFLRAGLPEAVVAFSSGGLGCTETLDLTVYEGEGYEQQLPRSPAKVAVAAGLASGKVEGESIVVPYGSEVDPLWQYVEEFVCEGDDKYLRAVPCKQYCTLTIVLTGIGDDDGGCALKVYAGSSDLGLYTGVPDGGKYCAEARRSGPMLYTVRIPRQAGNDLKLEISTAEGKDGLPAAEPKVLDLGREFSDAGYDWDRKNLLDASAVVDYARAEISFDIADWDIDGSFGNVEI